MKKRIARIILTALVIGLGFGMYSVNRDFFYIAVFVIVFVGLICWCLDVLDD